MRNAKHRARWFWPLVTVMLVFGAYGYVDPRHPADVFLECSYGEVHWNHSLHARSPRFYCQNCHHTDLDSEAASAACGNCHGDAPEQGDILTLADVTGGMEQLLKALPARASGQESCSPLNYVYHVKCQVCHADADVPHATCEECHLGAVPGSRGVVDYDFEHAEEEGDELLAGYHESIRTVIQVGNCADCHKSRWNPAEPELPNRRDASHRFCVECHEDMMTCNDCHD